MKCVWKRAPAYIRVKPATCTRFCALMDDHSGSFPEIGLSSLSTLVVHRNQRFSNILRIHHAIRRSGIVLVEDNG